MIKLENTEVLGWEHAIRGMRNPMNSWEKSDSEFLTLDGEHHDICGNSGPWYGSDNNWEEILIGENDHDLMMRLAKGGPVHAKYRRMIVVYVDITAPLYWWKEFDTYKVGTVANSCSTMHKIAAKEFTLEDFSCEHLMDGGIYILKSTIDMLNKYRLDYLNPEAESLGVKKKYWWQMIQLLPSSYNQKRTVMLNYEVLTGIYPSRKNHKLDEWHTFCDWIEKLPYSEIITGIDYKEIKREADHYGKQLMERGLRSESPVIDDRFGVLDAIIHDEKTDTIRTFPSFDIDDFPDGVAAVTFTPGMKIQNEGFKSLDDLKKELGIVSPSAHETLEHLVDVTCSWDEEVVLNGDRLYAIGPGFTRDDLTPYELQLLEKSEEYEKKLKE